MGSAERCSEALGHWQLSHLMLAEDGSTPQVRSGCIPADRVEHSVYGAKL